MGKPTSTGTSGIKSPAEGDDNDLSLTTEDEFDLQFLEFLAEECKKPDAAVHEFKQLLINRCKLIIRGVLKLDTLYDGVPQWIVEKTQSYYDGLKWAMSQSQEESDEDEAEDQAQAADADAGNEAHQKVDSGDH